MVALHLYQTIIGEGYPMGITVRIVYQLLRIFQWGLTIDHPRLMIKIRQESSKGRGFLQFLNLARKPKFPSLTPLFQAIEEFASKQGGEYLDRDEEVLP
jgi:hypothetical protein